MAINLNADVGELFKNLLTHAKKNGGAETAAASLGEVAGGERASGYRSPFMKPFAALGAVAVSLACYIGAYYMPQLSMLDTKNAVLAKTHDMQSQLGMLENKVAALKKKLSGSQEHYEEILSRFGDSDNLEALYHAVSTLALMHDITVLNVKGLDTKPHGKSPLIQETQVAIEMEGRYNNLMRFKEALLEDRALLTINTESLQLATDQAAPGTIMAKMHVTTYTIDKKPFHQAMLNSERMVASNE